AHHLRVDARRQQQRGGGVAQVVEADLRHRRLLQQEQETAHQIAREDWTTKRVAKDKITVAPRGTDVGARPFLTLPVATEHLDNWHCQRDLAAAAARLRLLPDPLAVFTFQLHTYTQHALVQLDILPAQAQQLTLAAAGTARGRRFLTVQLRGTDDHLR